MRFPNDTQFHLRMATLLVASLFLEHLAATRIPNWSAPQIGVITFVLGLVWVVLFAGHHGQHLQRKLRNLEEKLEQTTKLVEMLAEQQQQRRSLPPM